MAKDPLAEEIRRGHQSPEYIAAMRELFMSKIGEAVVTNTKKTGKFHGKSNALGHGGRAAQMKAQGVPGGVIGAIARSKGAAPGGKNYHGGKRGK